jgi:hypothetical protein
MSEPSSGILGRISGKLLAPNLVRNNIPLSFRINDDFINVQPLLHLDTENKKIGINTDAVTDELRIATNNVLGSTGTTKTIDLEILNNLRVGNIEINQNGNISSISGPIIVAPTQQTNPILEFQRVITDDLEINDNYIKNLNLNGTIILDASGTGTIIFNADTVIQNDLSVIGNITVTGDLSKQGNIIIGDEITDIVIIQTDFSQDIIPGDDLTYDLGTATKRWRSLYVNEPYNDTISVNQFININNRLAIDGNNRFFYPLQPNDDVVIDPYTGITILEQLRFIDDEILNLSNSPLVFESTGIGYYKFSGDSAFVIPSGNDAERVGNEIGETRWNTEQGYLECFDGNIWIISTGPGAVISPTDMEQLGQLYTLILG